MPKTRKLTATRRTTKKSPRRQAMKMLRATTADLSLNVSPSVRRKVRRNLPVAAAIVVGGAAITTSIAMRQQLTSLARVIGDAGASGMKSVAKALPVRRWLVKAGLRRQKPIWVRVLPAFGIVGGLLASGAAVFFFAPRGGNARQVLTDSMDSEHEFDSVGAESPSGANSMPGQEVPAHGRG